MNDGLWVISFSSEIVALFALRIESDVRCLEFRAHIGEDRFGLDRRK